MKASKLIVLLLIFAFLAPSVALAGEASPWTEKDGYGDRAIHKLDYGLKNLLAGWTEIIRQPIAAKNNDENVFSAFGQGLYDAVVYTVGGAIHTATFLCPKTDIPIKDGGVQF